MLRSSVTQTIPGVRRLCVRMFSQTTTPGAKISANNLNPLLSEVNYAVRGEIVVRAGEYEKQLKQGKQLPFKSIIYCNIGNPQQLLQTPISFHRQVLSLIEYPDLIPHVRGFYKDDVIARAQQYLQHLNINGTGPYCHSQGVEIIREEVANFIQQRDGHKADPANIFLTNGASSGVDTMLRLIIRGPNDGIMIPIPQYPLYSATIPMYNGAAIPYYLNEDQHWGLSLSELQRSFAQATDNGILPRALVVINPGNPTGQVLSLQNMQDIVRFCSDNDVLLMADEVYQDNVYGGNQFTSFRKVTYDLGLQDKIQLVSFHSISKGFLGECGKRGGYYELVGFDQPTKDVIYKIASISLCSNVTGQIIVGLNSNPPKAGDPSYPEYEQQKNSIIQSLERRSRKLVNLLNTLEGVSCNSADGAMYAFPKITIPPKAVEAANRAGKVPDMFYCLELLANTGICVVPGSGFGQREGTFHFRTTFLPKEENIDEVNQRLSAFHKSFLDQYR